MKAKSISHETATIQSFRDDPDFALAYLNSVLADGDVEEIITALNRITKANGKGVIATSEPSLKNVLDAGYSVGLSFECKRREHAMA